MADSCEVCGVTAMRRYSVSLSGPRGTLDGEVCGRCADVAQDQLERLTVEAGGPLVLEPPVERRRQAYTRRR